MKKISKNLIIATSQLNKIRKAYNSVVKVYDENIRFPESEYNYFLANIGYILPVNQKIHIEVSQVGYFKIGGNACIYYNNKPFLNIKVGLAKELFDLKHIVTLGTTKCGFDVCAGDPQMHTKEFVDSVADEIMGSIPEIERRLKENINAISDFQAEMKRKGIKFKHKDCRCDDKVRAQCVENLKRIGLYF